MKITMEFNLPVEKEEYETCYKGGEYYSLLEEARRYIRNKLKYDESITKDMQEVLEDLNNILWEKGI